MSEICAYLPLGTFVKNLPCLDICFVCGLTKYVADALVTIEMGSVTLESN